MKKITAVERLEVSWAKNYDFDDLDLYLIEQAKIEEREQMLNAFQESRLTHPMIGFKHETFEDYYNETFKSE